MKVGDSSGERDTKRTRSYKCRERSESLSKNSRKQGFMKFEVEEKGLIENLLTSNMQVR